MGGSTTAVAPVVRPSARPATPTPARAWARIGAYAGFFVTGATSLVFEVLWSNQFITVFGNSSYAVSVVLCAYMAGIGFGGLVGGRLADRVTHRVAAFGVVQCGIAVWALGLPRLLDALRTLVPSVAALSPESLLWSTLARFLLSFAVLAVPCALMGTAMPLLVRGLTNTKREVSRRISTLYSWNTLGAAAGCLAAGRWMLGTLGQQKTNLIAAELDLLIGLAALLLSRLFSPAPASPPGDVSSGPIVVTRSRNEPETSTTGSVLLLVAFVNGLAGLACEVIWFRYLAFLLFLGRPAYVFAEILCLYLLGLGLGGLVYRLLVDRIQSAARTLGALELLIGACVLATFVFGALVFASGPPPPLGVIGVAFITVFPPAVLMGIAFPLLCHRYGDGVEGLGRRIGLLLAVNTGGAMVGSLLPVFVLVPLLGLQKTLLLASLVFAAMGIWLSARASRSNRRPRTIAALYATVIVLFVAFVPADLCQRVFLALGFNLAGHTDILFYREGRTGTAIVTRDQLNERKLLYVNGNPEAPALYGHQLCFKLLGDLGPMLHPQPDEVLMVCFGGGIAARATECLPDVKLLTIVDLESSVVDAAQQLAEENNQVLRNPKTHVVIDDGRNYIVTTSRRWPVIITDSTHPKAPDSWVLYSREFYSQVKSHLTADGVFVQWVPCHDLTTDEYKTIVRTFQTVFQHTSLWISAAMDERGQFITYSLLVATPAPLEIDAATLKQRLEAGAVHRDLAPYGLHTPAGFLDSFVCADETLRHWAGGGQINTDNLPYTYYHTPEPGDEMIGNDGFIDLAEDIWPRLKSTDRAGTGAPLHAELALRARARRLAFSGRFADAFALLPADPRYQRMQRLYDDAAAYVTALANVFRDEPSGLNYAAALGAPGPATFRAAEGIYARVLKIDPQNLEALSMLGCMRSGRGDLAGAEAYLDRAAQLAPRSASAHYNLATLLLRKGALDQAVVHYRKALAIRPHYVDAETNLGGVFLQTGELDQAIEHFRRAVELKPDSVDGRYNLGLALARQGHAAEAIGCLQKALQDRPDDPAILNELAQEWVTASPLVGQNASRAVDLAEKANRLTGGQCPPVLHTLALAYAGAGRFGEAIKSSRTAIAIARAAGRQDLVAQLDREIRLYESGRPAGTEAR